MLIGSALLHAAWNTATKVARDKEMFVLATIFTSCLWVIAALVAQEKSFELGGRTGLNFAIVAGFFEGGYLVALSKGFAKTSLAKGYSIMRGGAMVVVWVVSLWLRAEHFNFLSLTGAFMVLIGIALTGIDRSKSAATHRSELFWPVLAAVFIAGYHLCYGESLKVGAEPKALYLTSLFVSLPFLFFTSRKMFWGRLRAVLNEDKLKIVFSSFATAAGFIIFLYGLKQSGPGYAISLRNSSIFFSIWFSFLINDKITKFQVLGSVIVGVGALILSLG